MVRLIAGFGGFPSRQHAGPKALWEGMQKVRASTIAFEVRTAAYTEDG